MANTSFEQGLAQTERLMIDLVGISGGPVADAAHFHLVSGGKRIRARLALSAAGALGLPGHTATSLAAASELIHNASLIHDDIQDQTPQRRGTATVWARFGADTAICTGDLMISAAYAAAAGAGCAQTSQLLQRIHLRISQVIAGQCADLDARQTPVHALRDYEQIAQAKSAPLLALPLDLALIAAGRAAALPAVERAAAAFAVAYQMADDLDDVVEDAAAGEINIVTLLGGTSAASPQAAEVRDMASARYRAAADLAGRLPEGCGALMATYAHKGAARLVREAVPA